MNKSKAKGMFLFLLEKVFKDWHLLATTIISLVLISGLEFSIPKISQWIIDVIIPNQEVTFLWVAIGLLITIALFLGILNYLSTYLISRISQTAIADLRADLYQRLLIQDMKFFETRKTGDMMVVLTSDISNLQNLISSNSIGMVGDIFTFVFILFFMLMSDWKLTAMVLLTFPFLFLTEKLFRKAIKQAYTKVRSSTGLINNQIQTTLTSVQLIKSYTTENFENQRFGKINDENKANVINASKLQALFAPTISFIDYIGMGIVLGIGAYQVIQGNQTVGALVAYLAYLRLLQNPVRSFTQMSNRIQQSLVSYERIEELLQVYPEIVEKEEAIPFTKFHDKLVFKQVSFNYQGDQEILKNLSFEMEKGKVIALVGSSGSGKSTITKLMTRFYDVDQGEILIDGRNIQDYQLASLRQGIGTVSQDVIILDGTIRENIMYGSSGADQEAVIEAAVAANIYTFILSLPDGFETQVGERGVRLSGGQKQRLAIARVFLKDAQIIILDEATASLDNESERYIQTSFDNLMASKTCLVIAHRLTTIKQADLILVVENGEIVERGTHESLLIIGGRYHDLYTGQFK